MSRKIFSESNSSIDGQEDQNKLKVTKLVLRQAIENNDLAVIYKNVVTADLELKKAQEDFKELIAMLESQDATGEQKKAVKEVILILAGKCFADNSLRKSMNIGACNSRDTLVQALFTGEGKFQNISKYVNSQNVVVYVGECFGKGESLGNSSFTWRVNSKKSDAFAAAAQEVNSKYVKAILEAKIVDGEPLSGDEWELVDVNPNEEEEDNAKIFQQCVREHKLTLAEEKKKAPGELKRIYNIVQKDNLTLVEAQDSFNQLIDIVDNYALSEEKKNIAKAVMLVLAGRCFANEKLHKNIRVRPITCYEDLLVQYLFTKEGKFQNISKEVKGKNVVVYVGECFENGTPFDTPKWLNNKWWNNKSKDFFVSAELVTVEVAFQNMRKKLKPIAPAEEQLLEVEESLSGKKINIESSLQTEENLLAAAQKPQALYRYNRVRRDLKKTQKQKREEREKANQKAEPSYDTSRPIEENPSVSLLAKFRNPFPTTVPFDGHRPRLDGLVPSSYIPPAVGASDKGEEQKLVQKAPRTVKRNLTVSEKTVRNHQLKYVAAITMSVGAALGVVAMGVVIDALFFIFALPAILLGGVALKVIHDDAREKAVESVPNLGVTHNVRGGHFAQQQQRSVDVESLVGAREPLDLF
jgi:hypothetical protein